MQESTHEQVWSDLKQSKFLLTQRNLAISNLTLKAHNSFHFPSDHFLCNFYPS